MPHVIIEHSNNIETDFQALCDAIYDALAAHAAIPHPNTLKIRVIETGAFRVGTDPQSFAHAVLKLLPGRDDATKAGLTQTILDEMVKAMPTVANLSVEAVDLDSASYAKP